MEEVFIKVGEGVDLGQLVSSPKSDTIQGDAYHPPQEIKVSMDGEASPMLGKYFSGYPSNHH